MSEVQKGLDQEKQEAGRERDTRIQRLTQRETAPAVTGETSADSRARGGVQLLRPSVGSGFCSRLEWPHASLQ